jgi:hypothetical protein
LYLRDGYIIEKSMNHMPLANAVKHHSDLDFGVILEGLRLYPESYVNFGDYWWTVKRMIADWVEENEADIDPDLLRGPLPPDALEVDESEIYSFLDRFSCREDFMDWIAYVNPPLDTWDEGDEEDNVLEDPDWEENFL